MTITAKIIADSINSEGNRLTTVQVRYPKYVHGEVMTHRVFSRNASSSRAIPVSKLAGTIDDMVEPLRYGKNKSGMQASSDNLEGEDLIEARRIWKDMAEYCAKGSQRLSELGLHKQWANRPLEWFTHINVIISSTQWSNFFALRIHDDAMPEIDQLARSIKLAQDSSTPKLLEGEWHLPYITDEDRAAAKVVVDISDIENKKERFSFPMYQELLIKMSVARCARVSYMTYEMKKPTLEEDLKLYDRLLGAQPIHASPAEHQALPDSIAFSGAGDYGWNHPTKHGNFTGWIQYRKTLAGECQ